MVFQISAGKRRPLPGPWPIPFVVFPTLRVYTGVLRVAEISMTPAALNHFVAQFPGTENGDDPSGITLWSLEIWVVQPLVCSPTAMHLGGPGPLEPPPKNPQDRFPAPPLYGYH
jgi:hypothetical protein